jgi:hypothetical protein
LLEQGASLAPARRLLPLALALFRQIEKERKRKRKSERKRGRRERGVRRASTALLGAALSDMIEIEIEIEIEA